MDRRSPFPPLLGNGARPPLLSTPSGGDICGGSGRCLATSSAEWYPALAVFSILFLGMAAGSFYALFTKYSPKPAPAR
jgi:hypothetical protein